MPSRRRFIRTVGVTGVVLGAGAVGLATCDRMPEAAIAPWQGPSAALEDQCERALAWAILAPTRTISGPGSPISVNPAW